MQIIRHRFLWAAVGVAMLVLVFAGNCLAGPNTLNRDSIPEKYKWDVSHIYPDWGTWEDAFVTLKALMDEYAALKGTLAGGPENLLRAKQLYDELDMLLYKVYRYPDLMRAVDTRDNEVAARFQRVMILISDFDVAASWFNPELLAIPWETMKTWLDETEGLAPYRFGLENMYRKQVHVLSEDKEQLLSYFNQSNRTARNVYQELTVSDIRYARIAMPDGDSVSLTPGRYWPVLRTNRNQDARAVASEAFFGVYDADVNTYAAIYNGVLQKDWALARARNYNSCLESYLDNDNIPVAIYANLVNTIREGTAPLRRYYNLRKDVLGLDTYHLYDNFSPFTDFERTYEYDEIIDWVIEAMKPLGEDYQRRLHQVFDDRWIDVYENEGKRTGASSSRVYGVHPYLRLNYDETLDYVFTVAHELGHCIHSILSYENQPYATSDYTIFVAEVASTMNEALLLEYMLERADDPKERISLLQQAIEICRGKVYKQSMWADFEWRTHQLVEQGEPVTAESLRELYYEVNHDYTGDAVILDDYYRSYWTRLSQFYRSPFYVYKYATSYAASAKLFREITSDDKNTREAALDRYLDLLKSGGNDYPVELLKKAGVDLSRRETIQAVVDHFDELVTRLEAELANL